MPFAHKVQRVTLSGTMFGGAEEWSTGFYFGQEGADAADWNQAAIDDVRNAWITFFEHANSRISNAYIFTQAKVAKLNVNETTDQSQVYYSYPGATVDGATAVTVLPPQCSLAVTLLSDRPRGRASKGRMYLPGIATNVDAGSGKVLSATIGAIADNVKVFFDALAASANIPDELILASRAPDPFGQLTAQNDYVETIRVGDVIDTQRRRRNGLVEVYTSRVLV